MLLRQLRTGIEAEVAGPFRAGGIGMPQPSYPYAVDGAGAGRAAADRRALESDAGRGSGGCVQAAAGSDTAFRRAPRSQPWSSSPRSSYTERLVDEISPDTRLTDVFLMRSDYHNAKAFLKMRQTSGDEQAALTPLGKVDNRELEEAVFKQEYSGLPEHLARAISAADAVVRLRPDPRTVDTVMDRAWYEWALSSVRSSRFLTGYFTAFADFHNLSSLIRARATGMTPAFFRETLLPGGTIPQAALSDAYAASGDLPLHRLDTRAYGPRCAQALQVALAGRAWEFEKFRDNYLTRYVRSRRWEHFSIEPVVAFLLAKEAEARAIRLIMAGKLNGVPGDVLGERLRELYA